MLATRSSGEEWATFVREQELQQREKLAYSKPVSRCTFQRGDRDPDSSRSQGDADPAFGKRRLRSSQMSS
jgi:hypothetical protein